MKKTLYVLFVFALVAAACSTKAPVTIATSVPTAMPIPLTATMAPTATPTMTQTPTPIPAVELSLNGGEKTVHAMKEQPVIAKWGFVFTKEEYRIKFAENYKMDITVDNGRPITISDKNLWVPEDYPSEPEYKFGTTWTWLLPNLPVGTHGVKFELYVAGRRINPVQNFTIMVDQ